MFFLCYCNGGAHSSIAVEFRQQHSTGDKAMTRGRIALAGIGLAFSLAVVPAAALAEDPFPSHTLEIVSHAAPGGGTDIAARAWMPAAQSILGQDFVIVYKQGGGARTALQYLMSKPADGHTILAMTETHLYTIAQGDSGVSIDDIKGVARAMEDPLVILVAADGPYKTYEDFVTAAKAKPLNWGVPQVGGTAHLALADWSNKTGAQYRVVPFGSGGETITALRSGAVDAILTNASVSIDPVREGDVAALAVFSKNRFAGLPDVPTAAEKGADVAAASTRGYGVRADTPPEIVAKLESALVQAMHSETFVKYLTGSGFKPEDSIAGSAVWDAQLKESYKSAKAAIDQLGLVSKK
jgi:putative tricarboxylic transport membrane protein